MKELFSFKALFFLNQKMNVTHLRPCQNNTEDEHTKIPQKSHGLVGSDANSFKVHRFLSRVALSTRTFCDGGHVLLHYPIQ